MLPPDTLGSIVGQAVFGLECCNSRGVLGCLVRWWVVWAVANDVHGVANRKYYTVDYRRWKSGARLKFSLLNPQKAIEVDPLV